MKELLEKLELKRRPKLLKLALTHPSAVGKGIARTQESNQRLEFLGDALLGSVIALHLYEEYPDLDEGQLTLRRIAIVRKESLAAAAKRLNLGKYLILGEQEASFGGRKRDSILSDAMEAMFAAIYLSFGQKAAARVIIKTLSKEIDAAAAKPRILTSSKNLLQEKTQAMGLGTPTYQTESTSDDPAVHTFRSHVSVNGKIMGEGDGESKKDAESAAAAAAINDL